MNFIGYPLSTTGLKQFTKLCFYGYSKAYTFNFNSILFFCYTFTFLFFTQSDFWTKSFVLKRLGHQLITCLFSKCLVLLLQLKLKLRPEKEFLSIEYFCESTNIFLNITFGLIQECVMVTSIFLIKRSSLSNKDLPIRSIFLYIAIQ